jgi:hypothetical protein
MRELVLSGPGVRPGIAMNAPQIAGLGDVPDYDRLLIF